MSRSAGQVVEKPSARGTVYALRFTALGRRQYVTLGPAEDGWTRERAEGELAYVIEQVRRGTWEPPEPKRGAPVPAPQADPSFHEFASEWLAGRNDLRAKTREDYEWRLASHLLPFFHAHRLTEVTVAEVDRYRQAKVREGALNASSVNKTLTLLGAILDVADERELIARNPMRVNPRRRKLRATRSRPVHLDTPEQLAALLEACRLLDAAPSSRTTGRLPLVASMAFAGLRVGEACALRWRDVDLAEGRLVIGASKTDAGMREVALLGVLRDVLVDHKLARSGAAPDDLVFPTATGATRDKDNVRERVLRPAVKRADVLLADRDLPPLPAGVTPHKLRHTFASILVALGRDPAYVMAQLGHTDPRSPCACTRT
ncbi:MAG: site-specific integrase [Actinomycetota bacterium]|nr:site-specific integrase [Actinomycetota bacterium]